MEITIEVRNIYGEDKVYPVCERAQHFARLLDQKTFTTANLANIRLLGYSVRQGVFAQGRMVTSIDFEG